jgi:beta-glucanase (GH16 family)
VTLLERTEGNVDDRGYLEREQASINSSLNFLTRRVNETLQSAAELDFMATNISHASVRTMARVSGSSGAVAGFFTYYNDTQEADIEVLTKDEPGRVHFSNQPTSDDDGNSIAGATFNETGPDYRNWNVYRMDWLPDEVVWFVNGVQIQRTSVHVPETESMFILNLWSNGGRFAGSMEETGSATMQVQWIEMVFNRHMGDTVEHRSGATVCTVDKVLGSPEPVSSATRPVFVDVRWLLLLALLGTYLYC